MFMAAAVASEQKSTEILKEDKIRTQEMKKDGKAA